MDALAASQPGLGRAWSALERRVRAVGLREAVAPWATKLLAIGGGVAAAQAARHNDEQDPFADAIDAVRATIKSLEEMVFC